MANKTLSDLDLATILVDDDIALIRQSSIDDKSMTMQVLWEYITNKDPIYVDSGNVGIGGVSTGSKLYVVDTAPTGSPIEAYRAGSSNICFKATNGDGSWYFGKSGTGYFGIASASADLNSQSHFIIDTSGNVGVGGTPSNIFDINKTESGSDLVSRLYNSSDTADSGAQQQLIVAGASGGDASTRYSVAGVISYYVGIDNSDSDNFKIAGNAGFGSADFLVINGSGQVNIPTAIASTSVSTGALVLSGASAGLGVAGKINCTAFQVAGLGTFSTLTSTGLATLAFVDINDGVIDNTEIGNTTPDTGKFTTLEATKGRKVTFSGNWISSATEDTVFDALSSLINDGDILLATGKFNSDVVWKIHRVSATSIEIYHGDLNSRRAIDDGSASQIGSNMVLAF